MLKVPSSLKAPDADKARLFEKHYGLVVYHFEGNFYGTASAAPRF